MSRANSTVGCWPPLALAADSGRITSYAEVIRVNPTAPLLPACRQYGQNRHARCVPSNGESVATYASIRHIAEWLPEGEGMACRYEIKHGNIARCMTSNNLTSQYVLGSTAAEHERLIRQAAWLTVHTERLFRDAGIGPGQRVLDLGSGVGDVSLIAARLVGPSGEVVGIERDPRSIARATARMTEAGLCNVSFTQSDAAQIPRDKSFDAAVGRYILCFLPDPVTVLRSLSQLVRPGGVLAFQEPDWGAFHRQAARLPLWSAGAALMEETFRRSGANTQMGPALSRVFQEAGLPAPSTRMDTLHGAEQWMPDCLHSLRPQMRQLNLSLEPLGDFETLSERLHAEAKAFNAATPLPDLASAWSRKPLRERLR